MNPTDPDEDERENPNKIPPIPPIEGSEPKPWQKEPPPQQQQQPTDNGSGAVDAGGGDLAEAGVEGAGLVGDIVSGAGDLAGGAIEVVGSVAAGAIEGAGSAAGAALEGAGGCADGCGGCSLAILVTLFAAAGTAMALFR